jgi:hypothetical protein
MLSSLLNQLQIYQIGDGLKEYYIFSRLNLTQSMSFSQKQQAQDSPFFDGKIRVNGIKRDYKDAFTLSVNFQISQDDDIQFLENLFVAREPLPIFFFKTSNNGNYQFYCNYGVVSGFDRSLKYHEDNGQSVLNKTITITFFESMLYEMKEDFWLIDKTKLNPVGYSVTSDSGALTFDNALVTARVDILKASVLTQQSYLQIIDNKIAYPVYWLDRMIYRQNTNLITNILDYTEDLTNALWVKSSGITLTNAQTDRFGNFQATQIAFGASNRVFQQEQLANVNVPYTASIWIKGTSGQTIRFGFVSTDGTTTYDFFENNYTLTGQWQQLTSTGTPANASATKMRITLGTYSGVTATTVTVMSPQLEQSTNASVYQPSIDSLYFGWDINGQNSLPVTLYNNSVSYITTKPIDLQQTAHSTRLAIRTNTSFSQNNSLMVSNLDNQTGFSFTWLATSSSPQYLLIFVDSGRVFNVATNQEILAENGYFSIINTSFYNGALTLQSLYNSVNNTGFLYNRPYINLSVQKNTSSNLSLIIKHLKTFN